jgi:hypothetical protein
LSSFVVFKQVDLLIKVENLGFVIPSERRGIFSGIIPHQPSCGFATRRQWNYELLQDRKSSNPACPRNVVISSNPPLVGRIPVGMDKKVCPMCQEYLREKERERTLAQKFPRGSVEFKAHMGESMLWGLLADRHREECSQSKT